MFNEANMMKALSWLHDLYQPDDYYDEEYRDLGIEEFPPRDLCGALRQMADTLYEYKVDSDNGCGFNYRSKELMPMRGIPIVYEMTEIVEDIGGATIRYGVELWLMEDMSFAIVNCVETMLGDPKVSYHTSEYRSFVKSVECRDDLPFSPESIWDNLELDCIAYTEGSERTIYEL